MGINDLGHMTKHTGKGNINRGHITWRHENGYMTGNTSVGTQNRGLTVTDLEQGLHLWGHMAQHTPLNEWGHKTGNLRLQTEDRGHIFGDI